jgi:hypothetical protein
LALRPALAGHSLTFAGQALRSSRPVGAVIGRAEASVMREVGQKLALLIGLTTGLGALDAS